ncbi:MAG TPA: hypothetical protein VIC87_10975 [Vicinamibacteria bacterium]
MGESRDPSPRLDALARELEEVRRRLDRLEAREGPSGVTPRRDVAGEGIRSAVDEARAERAFGALPAGTIALVGRTLVVLAGAFLLRAITDAGLVPGRLGALAGLAYAAAFLLAAHRAPAGGRPSAVSHGLAAVLIAYPLLWEAAARFGVLSAAASGAALLAFLGFGLAVAARHALGEVAWANVLFAGLTALGLLVRTRELVTFTLVLLVAAAAVEALAFHDRWPGLRWPAALFLDLAVATVAFVQQREGRPPEGYPLVPAGTLIAIGLALAGVYVTGMAARTLRHGRPVTPFEMLQTPTALLLGYGVAAGALAASRQGLTGVGVLALLLGGAGYAVSFSFLERRPEFGRNFYAYSTLGGTLTLVGTRLLLPATAGTAAWSALAVGAAFLGARFARVTLKVHGALYLVAAATGSGLLAHASHALLRGAGESWRALTPPSGFALVAAGLCYAILAARGGTRDVPASSRVPALIVGATLAWSLAGLVAGGLAAILAKAPGPAADAPVLGAVRTAVIAGTAVVLAGAGRRFALPELTWLVYPTLAGGALQLLVESLARGRPITLFVAFALYGGALVMVSRLTRGERD